MTTLQGGNGYRTFHDSRTGATVVANAEGDLNPHGQNSQRLSFLPIGEWRSYEPCFS